MFELHVSNKRDQKQSFPLLYFQFQVAKIAEGDREWSSWGDTPGDVILENSELIASSGLIFPWPTVQYSGSTVHLVFRTDRPEPFFQWFRGRLRCGVIETSGGKVNEKTERHQSCYPSKIDGLQQSMTSKKHVAWFWCPIWGCCLSYSSCAVDCGVDSADSK